MQNEYNKALEDPAIKTIVIDSASLLRQISSLSHLAEVRRHEPNRKSLTPFEYVIPNAELREFILQAPLHNKILVLIHHVRAKFEEPSILEADGFGETGDLVDVELWMTKGKNDKGEVKPKGIIKNCGVCMRAEGMDIPEPSFTKLDTLIGNLRKLK